MNYNIYCDESCHIENDGVSVMVLGAVTCRRNQLVRISNDLRQLKSDYGLLTPDKRQRNRSQQFEIKWTKVSPAKIQFYSDCIRYFFQESALSFRSVVIEKRLIDHAKWSRDHGTNQTHDDWYYKMFFRLIEPMIDPQSNYRIYLDIKDTRSESNRKELERVLRSATRDRINEIISRVQQIRSYESEIMQMTDLLMGALGYHHRCRLEHGAIDNLTSPAKQELIRLIQELSRQTLDKTSWMKEPKFNLLIWHPREVSQ
jgi:hypothetical protein